MKVLGLGLSSNRTLEELKYLFKQDVTDFGVLFQSYLRGIEIREQDHNPTG